MRTRLAVVLTTSRFALRLFGTGLEQGQQRGLLERRILLGQQALSGAAAAERAQAALAALRDEVRERPEPARAGAGGGDVERGPVLVQRGDELVDPGGRRQRGHRDD